MVSPTLRQVEDGGSIPERGSLLEYTSRWLNASAVLKLRRVVLVRGFDGGTGKGAGRGSGEGGGVAACVCRAVVTAAQGSEEDGAEVERATCGTMCAVGIAGVGAVGARLRGSGGGVLGRRGRRGLSLVEGSGAGEMDAISRRLLGPTTGISSARSAYGGGGISASAEGYRTKHEHAGKERGAQEQTSIYLAGSNDHLIPCPFRTTGRKQRLVHRVVH